MINTDIAVYYKIDAALSGYQIFKRCSGIIGDTDIISAIALTLPGGLELLAVRLPAASRTTSVPFAPVIARLRSAFNRYAFSLTLSLHGCCSFGSDIVDIHSAIGLYG